MTFSHPVRGADHGGGHPADSYFVQSIDGTTHALNCPKNSHIVTDRLVYVCPQLTLVRPTSADVCAELERPCAVVDATTSGNVRPPTFWVGRAPTNHTPQAWDASSSFGVVGPAGGTGLTTEE